MELHQSRTVSLTCFLVSIIIHIWEHDESGYAASFPELHGCLSCGETVSDAIANAMDAKRTWLEAALEKGVSIREPNGAKRS